MADTSLWMPLNGRQRKFARLYLGDTELHGNATRCYMVAYGQNDVPSAQRASSRLMKNPHLRALIADVTAKAAAQVEIDAAFVQRESVRLYKRAMGDEPFDQVSIERDPNTGQERVRHRETRSYDASTARAALQLIGQHRDVQAFSVTVEHNHTHHLEQRLAARSRMIEGRAQVLDDDSQVTHQGDAGQLPGLATDPAQVEPTDPPASDPIPAPAQGINDDNHVHAAEPGGDIEAPAAADAAKRVHASGGQSPAARTEKAPARERGGATADLYIDKST